MESPVSLGELQLAANMPIDAQPTIAAIFMTSPMPVWPALFMTSPMPVWPGDD
jgi:hypothetical protein